MKREVKRAVKRRVKRGIKRVGKRAKKRGVKVALVQMLYSKSSEQNVARIKKYISLAKRSRAEIVCFPESCLHQSKNFDINHKFVKEIREECKRNSIWAIINDNFRIKGKLYNAALLINREGKIAGIYKKINAHGEDVELGKKTFVYKTDFAKIGIAICWDLRFPQVFEKMKKKGAELVFCPARWCYEFKAYSAKRKQRERRILKGMLRSRAFENLFFVAVVNPVIRGRYFRDLVSYTGIATPHRIENDIQEKPGMITAKLNLNEIKKAEKMYPLPDKMIAD